MKYRNLGSSDLEVPVVSFGAWAIGGLWWGGTDDNAAIRAIRRALDLGVRCIDTAAVYGAGHSERVVGRAIAKSRDQVILATKCGSRWGLSGESGTINPATGKGELGAITHILKAESIKEECEASLKRLETDYIDLYQCHWPDETDTPIEETMGALLDLQKAGKIRYFGVSNFSTELMEECLRYAPIVSDQPPYNALRRDIERDIIPFCREHDIGILAYSPLAQGLLTGKVTLDRQFPPTDVRSSNRWFSRKIVPVPCQVLASSHTANAILHGNDRAVALLVGLASGPLFKPLRLDREFELVLAGRKGAFRAYLDADFRRLESLALLLGFNFFKIKVQVIDGEGGLLVRAHLPGLVVFHGKIRAREHTIRVTNQAHILNQQPPYHRLISVFNLYLEVVVRGRRIKIISAKRLPRDQQKQNPQNRQKPVK
ncbi:MAG: aldo/keto reductase [Candidatus Hydrogenedentota bacterium]